MSPTEAQTRGAARGREVVVTGAAADDLLLDVVRPVHERARAAGAVTSAFCWRDPERLGGGVRYRLRAGEQVADDVAAQLAARLATRLAAGRPNVRDDAQAALVPAGEERFDLREIFGGPLAEPTVEELLTAVSGPVFATLARVRAGERVRAEAAFDLMVATAVAINRSLFPSVRGYRYPTSFICFRSSADGFILMGRDPARSRALLDARYEPHAAAFRARFAAVLAQCQGDGPAVSAEAAWWLDALAPRIPVFLDRVRAGEVTARTDPGGYLGDALDLGASAFHQVIDGSPAFQDFMRTDPGFHAMRVALSLLCAVLHQLGIRVVDRYVLSHALARAAEETFGVSAAEVLAGLPEMRPA